MPVVRNYLVRHASSHPRTRGVFVHWQVMELCRGGELFERIQQQQQFDEKSAAVLVRGMGEVRRLQRRPTDIHPHQSPRVDECRSRQCFSPWTIATPTTSYTVT